MSNLLDVVIIGGGPSGLSAAIFTSDKGLKTLVLDDHKTVMKAAYVDNYLGFSQPFLGTKLIDTGYKQLKSRNVSVEEEKVTEVKKEADKFTVKTDKNTYEAKYIILAVGQGGLKLADQLGVEMVENNEPFTKKKIKINERSSTSLQGVYATGIGAGVSSQAIVAAGHGAQTALNLISEIKGERVHIHKTPPK